MRRDRHPVRERCRRLPGGRTGPPPFDEIATVWEVVTDLGIAGATASWTDAFDDGCDCWPSPAPASSSMP